MSKPAGIDLSHVRSQLRDALKDLLDDDGPLNDAINATLQEYLNNTEAFVTFFDATPRITLCIGFQDVGREFEFNFGFLTGRELSHPGELADELRGVNLWLAKLEEYKAMLEALPK